MATKVMILTGQEIQTPRALTKEALDAYEFALKNAGQTTEETEPAFISARNAKINGFTDLWEFKSWCEKTAASIKEVCKHSFNVGDDEELPKNVSWSKQNFTRTFENPKEAIKKLIELEATPMENFLQWVTPKQAAEAAGITEDRLNADIGEMIIETPKERTLKIK